MNINEILCSSIAIFYHVIRIGLFNQRAQSVQCLMGLDTRLNAFTSVVKLYLWEIDLLESTSQSLTEKRGK